MNDKRFHVALKLTEEEKWKLRAIAVRKKLRVSELVTARVKEIIETEGSDGTREGN